MLYEFNLVSAFDIRVANGRRGDMLTLLRGEYAVLADLMARRPPFGGEGHAARLECTRQGKPGYPN